MMESHLLRFVEQFKLQSGDQLVSGEFNLLRQRSATIKKDYGLTAFSGLVEENVKKNRYKDILPYDQTRVCLTPTSSEYQSDYINASFIKGTAASRSYIATQGPLSSTVIDFWRMVWQFNVKVILMACREIEMGRKKCEVYWAAPTETSVFGPFSISTVEESRPNEELVVRMLVVKLNDEAHEVSHFQYMAWPDHGIPDTPDGILGMMELAGQKQGCQTDPIVIHCSAGCGRTGVVCAVDSVRDLLLAEKIPADFNILDLVFDLRKQRPSAVQTKEQYGFVFQTVAQLFQKLLAKRARAEEKARSSDALYINGAPLKSGSLGSSDAASLYPRKVLLKARLSHPLPQTRMNDTYATVNKPKLPPSGSDPPLLTVHHYDNFHLQKNVISDIYSTVKPKNRAATPHPPVSRSTETDSEGYELLPVEFRTVNEENPVIALSSLSKTAGTFGSRLCVNDDYEYVSKLSVDSWSALTPGSLGFNSRIKKPKGPRDPPAVWSRSER